MNKDKRTTKSQSKNSCPKNLPLTVNSEQFWEWSDPIYEDDGLNASLYKKLKPIKSLKSLCTEVLSNNIDLLYKMKHYPIDLTLAILKDCKVDSLYWFERRNESLRKSTDILWERHFKARYPRSNLQNSIQSTHGWRHCFMVEKKEEAEKAKRFEEKQKAAKEALRNKRQVKIETYTRNHSMYSSPYERGRIEAQALKANPEFERLRRQTLQNSQQATLGRRPLPTPAGIPIGISFPVAPLRLNSSPSMSPPDIRNHAPRHWNSNNSYSLQNTSSMTNTNPHKRGRPDSNLQLPAKTASTATTVNTSTKSFKNKSPEKEAHS